MASSFNQSFPLERGNNGKFIIGIVASLSILIMLIFSGFSKLHKEDQSHHPCFTIKILNCSNKIENFDQILYQIMEILKSTSHLKAITILKNQFSSNFTEEQNEETPLSNLDFSIEIRLSPFVPESVVNMLTESLSKISDNLHIESLDKSPKNSAYGFADFITKNTLLVIELIILAIIMLVVSLVTKTSLEAHHPVINSLRLIGADNSFIAKQFQKQAFVNCLKGGTLGLIGGISLMSILNALSKPLDTVNPYFLDFKIIPSFVILFLVIPFVSIVVARLTVTWLLYRLER